MENKIETMHIGGKDRKVWFGQVAVDMFLRKLRTDERGLIVPASSMYATVYAALYAGAYVSNQEQDFTFEEVCQWVDDLYNDGKEKEIEVVINAFTATKNYKGLLDKAEALGKELKSKKKKP